MTNVIEKLYAAAYDLMDMGMDELAKANLLKVIAADPDNPEPHLLLSMILLSDGEFIAGWREYHKARNAQFTKDTYPPLLSMWWNGMKLPTKLLVFSDQGWGDQFHFCRFLTEASKRVGELHVLTHPGLSRMIGEIPGVAGAYELWSDAPAHAAHIRMSHLPVVLNVTEQTMIPEKVPYLFAEPTLKAKWKEKLGPGFHVGWHEKGNPMHFRNARRELTLAQMQPIFDVPGVTFHHLAKSDDLPDWEETAALVSNLDLVITVDTAVGHLAGALGIPVWLFVGRIPLDWRWMRERTDSPWYPGHRLFRQKKEGDWKPVIKDVEATLWELVVEEDLKCARR